MRNSSYAAFLLLHDWPNCFAYTRNITSVYENADILERVSSNNLLGCFCIRACENPEREFCVQVFGCQPFTHVYVNRTFAAMAKFKCNQEVIMDLVNPTVCTSIEIVPLSRDDYEILERSSNSVEEVFLQQIRIVGPGMRFPLWITPSVCATFRVEHISPSSNQATLVIPSTVLNILTPTEGRYSPTSNEHPTAKKIKISDLFPRICGTVSDFSTPLPFCAKAFRVVPNSLVKESILLTSLCHPCVIYILGDESLHYSLYSVTLVESALNPSIVQFALSISVPSRSVSDDVFSESIVSVLKMKPNLCVVPNNDYLAYSTILLTTVSERQIVFVKNVDVFPSAEDLECFLSSERRRDIEQSLRDMVVVHPLLLSAKGLSLSVNLGTRSVMVHLVPVDDMTPKERHRQELCCFTAEAACTFTLKFEPFAKKSTISLSEPDNYGFLSHNYSLNLGSHSILINELSEWAEYCWSHTGFGHALLLGSEGSGKTAIASCVARKLAFDHCAISVRVNCSLWKGTHSETVEKKISTEIKKLSARKPSLLILDNFDLLNVAYEEEQRNLEVEKVFQMLWRLLSASIVPVLIVAKQMNSLLKSTITPVGKRLFAVRKTIPSLNQNERLQVLYELLGPNSDLFPIAAKATENLSLADMRRLATRIQIEAKIRAPLSYILKCDIDAALLHSRSADCLSIKSTNEVKLSLEDVGGMEEEKRTLLEVLIWPFKYREVFQSYGMRLGKGVVLHGPSGCGKTLLAKAIAAYSNFNSVFVKGPELLSKYIGASEENVRNVFERARASAPCIIIFDEMDSLAPQRGSDSTGVTDRVVNQLLTEMDGAEGLQGVFVIGCSSRIDLIDSALLRPGRFDHLLECHIPNKQERSEILGIVLRRVNYDPTISVLDWAARTDGWTGADLKALITNAHFNATRNSPSDLVHDEVVITNENIEAVFEESLPRHWIDAKQELRVGEKVTLA